MEDQRCSLPDLDDVVNSVPEGQEDFFSLIQRVQSRRMDEQRASLHTHTTGSSPHHHHHHHWWRPESERVLQSPTGTGIHWVLVLIKYWSTLEVWMLLSGHFGWFVKSLAAGFRLRAESTLCWRAWRSDLRPAKRAPYVFNHCRPGVRF